jgi:hypothetical protein
MPVFPDITKLCDETPTDVYGAEKQIPAGDLFVAGTVCKDFSMRKTKHRIDLEEKGQSGHTFFGAVEFLMKFKPRFAVFENVNGAPWDKMQEYITGLVVLSSINDAQKKGSKCVSKKNKDAATAKPAAKSKDKNAPPSDLTLTSLGNGGYEVEDVPPHVGVAAGAKLLGVLRGRFFLDLEVKMKLKSRWVYGRVTKCRSDGTYDIELDSGDKEKSVDPSTMFSMPAERKEDQYSREGREVTDIGYEAPKGKVSTHSPRHGSRRVLNSLLPSLVH